MSAATSNPILTALTPSVSVRGSYPPKAERQPEDGVHCPFCGAWRGDVPFGVASADALSACALCSLVLHLDRARIDDEATLIWLPEMGQPGLNLLARRIAVRLRALDEPLGIETVPVLSGAERGTLYHARRALLERRELAELKFGSTSPAELADALLRMSNAAYGSRGKLLGGLRVLATGHLFEGPNDVFPSVVESWAFCKAREAA